MNTFSKQDLKNAYISGYDVCDAVYKTGDEDYYFSFDEWFSKNFDKDNVEYLPVDLRTCKKGDILISKHGTRLKYIRPLPEDNYYDHEVEYPEPNCGNGTRTHNGQVFRKNREDTDEDIVEIIHI